MTGSLKLLIMALDGATPSFIDQHRMELPHFHSVIRKGTWGVVAGPPFSYDRWFTYYTGLSADQHGMEAMRHSTAGRVTLNDAKAKQFLWDYVAKLGLRFGMLGGLGCEPPVPVDGFWVNFYFDQFHPQEAEHCCTNLWTPIFPHPVCDEIGTKPWDQVSSQAVVETLANYDWNELVDWAAQRQSRQRSMFDALAARWPVDVLWYYAFELDWTQHLAAHRPDTLLRCYKVVDDTLGYLQTLCQPHAILLVSDHGLRPLGLDIPYPNLKALPGVGACLPLEDRQTVWTGEHHAEAFYACSGPGVAQGARQDIDDTDIFSLICDRLLPPPMAGGQHDHKLIWKVRAPLYPQLDWVRRADLLALMISHCRATPRDRALDLGTGTGMVACALAGQADHVLGVDREPAMVEQARSNCPKAEFRVMDVEQLELPDQSVDLVTARMTLHHVSDLSRAVGEALRVLRVGGRLVICEGVPPNPSVVERYREIFKLKEPGRHIFTADSLDRLLDEAGFVDIQLHACVVPQVSMKNWLGASGVPPQTCAQIEQLHRSADPTFWAAYNMKEVGDDLLMDWKFVVASGVRGET